MISHTEDDDLDSSGFMHPNHYDSVVDIRPNTCILAKKSYSILKTVKIRHLWDVGFQTFWQIFRADYLWELERNMLIIMINTYVYVFNWQIGHHLIVHFRCTCDFLLSLSLLSLLLQPRWLSDLRRSHVHSLLIARRSLCPEKLGSNPGQGSKGNNFSGWHGLDMSVTVTKRR